MKKLELHHGQEENTEVYFDLIKEKTHLLFNFQVDYGQSRPFYSNGFNLKDPQKNWGLWDYDVVELFFYAADRKSYYEFQLSPLNQGFQLEIFKPRISFCTPLDWSWQSDCQIIGNKSWKGFIKIPLEIFSKGPQLEFSEIFGNVHAILGEKNLRKYYSLNPYKPSQGDGPDFHRPGHFIKLC